MREPSSVGEPSSRSEQPASAPAEPLAGVPAAGVPAAEAEVLARLHEQARRVAREARRAEAARRAVAAPGRHRAPEKLQVTRVSIRAVPGRYAVPTVDGGEPVAVRAAPGPDDDAIEERNGGG